MKLLRATEISRRNDEFEVLTQGKNLQLANMVLAPGATSGEYGNEHPDSDQLVIVTQGQGEARVEEEIVALSVGDVLLIVAGEKHQVRNTSESPFVSLNIYAPPAY